MKKFTSMLLIVVMVLSLCSCSKDNSVSSAKSSAKDSQVIYGTTSTFAGDWGFNQWSSIGADKPVIFLTNAYAPTCYDKDAQWIWDKTVVSKQDITKNADGTQTYTMTINKGLTFNDGSPITAKNYAAYMLLLSSPAAIKDAAYGTAGQQFVGHDEYMNGKANTFEGVRLIDDYTLSIHVDKKYCPYYYGLALMNFFPVAYTQWLGDKAADVKDDGKGAYFKTSKDFTADNYKAAIDAGRFINEGRICSGPYYIKSFDAGANECILNVNKNYVGNFEGQKASIDTIIIKSVDSATMLDSLKTGEIDIIDGIGDGDMINSSLDLKDKGGYGADCYTYSGYMKLFFQCDWGPTQYESVRKAIAYLTNREEICQKSSLGYGTVVNGQYSNAQWMAQDLEEKLNTQLEHYDFNSDKAIELLKKDGWIYNADGTKYSDGSGKIRYKKVTIEETKYDEAHCVKVGSQWYMGLIFEYCGHAQGEGIETKLDELLDIYLCESKETTNAGAKFIRTVMSDSELCSYLNRRGANGDSKYETPTYNILSLASGLGAAKFDKSYCWTFDETKIANNKNRFFNKVLDQTSMDMIYGTEAGDDDTFKDHWLKYQVEYNATLPELPLFNWAYCTVYNSKLKGFKENNIWSFQYAILYATVEK